VIQAVGDQRNRRLAVRQRRHWATG
jgi:hypothetical protein